MMMTDCLFIEKQDHLLKNSQVLFRKDVDHKPLVKKRLIKAKTVSSSVNGSDEADEADVADAADAAADAAEASVQNPEKSVIAVIKSKPKPNRESSSGFSVSKFSGSASVRSEPNFYL